MLNKYSRSGCMRSLHLFQAKEILLETLTSGGPPEKWAAAQCLSYSGCDADMVVNELISNINSTDLVKHSKAVKLLGRLSKQSVRFLFCKHFPSAFFSSSIHFLLFICHGLPYLARVCMAC